MSDIKVDFEVLFALFNIVLGTIFLLIKFRIYRPFSKDKEDKIIKQNNLFLLLGGIGLIAWGVFQAFKHF
ncbi:MAG TPA: hypothetical protein VD908_14020 [Cytophagales bacterium]|nr:hypothetical protein [Cytophagales bacterium]